MRKIVFFDSLLNSFIGEYTFEYEQFEEDGSVWMAEEPIWRGVADELQELHFLKGAQFIKQLIFKGRKVLPVNRIQVQSPDFNRVFRKRYEK